MIKVCIEVLFTRTVKIFLTDSQLVGAERILRLSGSCDKPISTLNRFRKKCNRWCNSFRSVRPFSYRDTNTSQFEEKFGEKSTFRTWLNTREGTGFCLSSKHQKTTIMNYLSLMLSKPSNFQPQALLATISKFVARFLMFLFYHNQALEELKT